MLRGVASDAFESAEELPHAAPDAPDSDSSSDGEIPLCDAPVVKKRKVETVATSRVKLTDSERYKREDAGCAARLKKQEPELLPCIDPEIGEDDQGVGARFQGYDGFTIGGPPVFPIQARGYWQQRVLPGEWKSSTGEDRYRRTL